MSHFYVICCPFQNQSRYSSVTVNCQPTYRVIFTYNLILTRCYHGKVSFFYLLDHPLFFILPFSKSYFPNQTVSFTMVSHNDTTVHDDCADSSASSSASSSVDVHFDGPLGHGDVIFTDKKSGKFISSYNQQDVLTQDDVPLSSFYIPFQCITQSSESSPPPPSALVPASSETQYE